jgi:hypothetical protein
MSDTPRTDAAIIVVPNPRDCPDLYAPVELCRELERENAELRKMVENPRSSDSTHLAMMDLKATAERLTVGTFQKEIDATHPMEDAAGDQEFLADALAMKLVGARYEKRDLVDLVRWLILRKPEGLI